MAETQVQANGDRFIDTVDPDDPEYIRQMQKPAVIKEDVKEMDRRKRVNLILSSQAFREELEDIISSQIQQGPHPASLIALQQISELILPQARFNQSVGRPSNALSRGGSAPILPVADIRGADAAGYAKGEKLLRCKLASLYRLVDLFGWSHGIYNHITARVNQDNEHFLLNPFGLLYSEVTASSLAKVNLQGEVVDTGSTVLGVNEAGFTLHSAIHAARPTIRCVIHLHTRPASAVSA
ncbi:PREDICTED: alpha-adducin-like, partial [Priapulus caudatus]|uniref:Alpha-adducin-like n=1 Tax=Priapulus caudatus TaxID=37621 RepID=A0ABM1E2F2_PRICU